MDAPRPIHGGKGMHKKADGARVLAYICMAALAMLLSCAGAPDDALSAAIPDDSIAAEPVLESALKPPVSIPVPDPAPIPPPDLAASAPAGSPAGDKALSSDLAEESLESEKSSPALRGEAVTGAPPSAPSPSASGSSASARPTPSASGLRAGYSDDNAQFNYFTAFLDKYASVPHIPYDIQERLGVRVLDAKGKSLPNALVTVSLGSREIARGLTHADGLFRFYPAALAGQEGLQIAPSASFDLSIQLAGRRDRIQVRRDGPRLVEHRLGTNRSIAQPIPLDILFILDTTGSMGEEIERLRATIEIIYANANALKPRPFVRFGLVLYKDRGDEYVTRVTPFTDDLSAFQDELDAVFASGGGDRPEDLQAALDDSLNAMDWNEDGIRLAFAITDADAQLYDDQIYNYIHAANDARERGIKIYTIGTGGLPLEGEYVLRQIAQLSDARYIFLNYGEQGESEGGAPGSVSHHTGSNYTTDKLEAIIIRFIKEEVAYLSDTPLDLDQAYFNADKIDGESRDDTLGKLFTEALGNLLDYSSYRILASTPMALLPIAGADSAVALNAEYFGERLILAAAAMDPKRFTMVERKDIQKLLEELELQLSGLVDEAGIAKLGGFLGADVVVSGSLYRRAEGFELFLKLMRVSTAEILSVTRAKIDFDLGL
jgi:Mg-chelatase subunit ChlD